MKKLLALIFVFSLISMNVTHAMDICVDVDSGNKIQIIKSVDGTSNNDDTSSDNIQCQIHCGHAAAHAFIGIINSPEFNLASTKFSLPEFRLPYSLNLSPLYQPPIS